MSLFVVHGRNIFGLVVMSNHCFPQSECRIIHKSKIGSTENMQMLAFTLEEKNPQISGLKDSF